MMRLLHLALAILFATCVQAAPFGQEAELPQPPDVAKEDVRFIAEWGGDNEQARCPLVFVDAENAFVNADNFALTKTVSADPRLIRITTHFGKGATLATIRVRNASYRLMNQLCNETIFSINVDTGKMEGVRESACYPRDTDMTIRADAYETKEEFEERARTEYIDTVQLLVETFRRCDRFPEGKENDAYPEAK